VFTLPDGQRRIATVSVKNSNAEALQSLKVGESETMSVNLETTLLGVKAGLLLLADSEFLPLDEPEGFVALGEDSPSGATASSTKTEPGKAGSLALGSISGATTRPVYGSSGSSIGGIGGSGGSRSVQVRGHYRRDGTYVHSYSRSSPGSGSGRRR
jgi:hypothetical protein